MTELEHWTPTCYFDPLPYCNAADSQPNDGASGLQHKCHECFDDKIQAFQHFLTVYAAACYAPGHESQTDRLLREIHQCRRWRAGLSTPNVGKAKSLYASAVRHRIVSICASPPHASRMPSPAGLRIHLPLQQTQPSCFLHSHESRLTTSIRILVGCAPKVVSPLNTTAALRL